MLPRFVRIQLLAFGIVAFLGIGYASFVYVGLPRLVGFGQYSASVQLPSAGGLYAGAQVTLRGVEIGRVTAVRLADGGVVADLSLDVGTPVPADARVAVQNMSAIGEQYIDLVPDSGAADQRVLRPGEVIPANRVTLPPQIGDVLASTDRLVRSVPQDSLRTTLDEVSRAFSGSGQDIQRLLDSSHLLLTDAQADIVPTVGLINDLQPVLATQERVAPDIRSYFQDLAAVSGRLRADDPAVRGILDRGPAFSTELTTLFDQVRPTVPLLLANLTSVGQVVETYVPNVAQSLVILPVTINNLQSALNNNRGVPSGGAIDFKATVNDPPACTTGFTDPVRDPSDLSPLNAPTDSYCKEAPDSAKEIRGARQNPCPNDPTRRAADAAGCGLDFQTPAEAAQSDRAAEVDLDGGGSTAAARIPEGVPYDQVTGLSFTPDGSPFSLGTNTRDGTVPTSWKAFFLDPLQIPTS
ncbi:MAG: phospholipid/cholesterol/gamma-HCH transport system substrate-binding protein [Pseudonocardiales bacterium]|jgi:phospholipid/cholesterol/gamma-HCH transport system substrate-binding protein|nr:phospholipid/cholesterol/gamma-HCH transport system substrate-binding protein [Pseudonocardiales bacterium]